MTWVNPFDAVSLGGGAAPLVVTEPVTIRATTTAPKKPSATPVLDYITVVDDGSGWCNLSMNLSYETSLAGAEPGSGIYLFALPGAYQFDLGYHTPSPDTVQAFTSQIMVARTIPGSRGLGARYSTVGAYAELAARVYDANHFTMYVSNPQANTAIFQQVSGVYFALTTAVTMDSLSMAFRFKKG